jgi:hypothetical protein
MCQEHLRTVALGERHVIGRVRVNSQTQVFHIADYTPSMMPSVPVPVSVQSWLSWVMQPSLKRSVLVLKLLSVRIPDRTAPSFFGLIGRCIAHGRFENCPEYPCFSAGQDCSRTPSVGAAGVSVGAKANSRAGSCQYHIRRAVFHVCNRNDLPRVSLRQIRGAVQRSPGVQGVTVQELLV